MHSDDCTYISQVFWSVPVKVYVSLLTDRLKTGSHKSYRLFRVVFVGLTLLTTIVLASVVPEMTAIEVRKKLNNAVQLEHDIGMLQSAVLDAETSQRGFLLTSDNSYLLPYFRARDTLPGIFSRLETEVSRDSVQLKRLVGLRASVRGKFREMQRTITATSNGDSLLLDSILSAGGGLEMMAAIQQDVEALRTTELRDIRVRQAQLAQLSTVTTILRFLGVLGLGFVFYYIYSQLRPLFDTITDANDRLQQENQERLRVEKENEALIASLNEKNRELDQFAYIASHDLREPLRTVSNYIEVLGEDYTELLDDNGRGHMATIHRATDRMRALIDTLLLYSRLGRSEEVQPVPLHHPVSEALENLPLRVYESEAQISLQDLPTVEGYPVALRQLFQNLLANAIKFHLPGETPRVEVAGKTVDGIAYVTVKDYGIGMETSDQRRVFQLFTRLKNSEMKEGQGIGLAFCQKIVQLHQGTIAVESKPGHGCIFTVTLPSQFKHEEARVHYVD